MDMIERFRNDGNCRQCIFCGVGKKETAAACPPPELFPNAGQWPALYSFPSCSACAQAARAEGDALIALIALVGAARNGGAGSAGADDAARPTLVARFAARLAKAMFYHQHARIFPDFGAIYFYWEAAAAPPLTGVAADALLEEYGVRETVHSGNLELDRQFVLDVAASTDAVNLHAHVPDALRLLVFADVSPDTLAANTHDLYQRLPGGLQQAQAGLYE